MLRGDQTRFRVLIHNHLAELSHDDTRGLAAQGVVALDQQSVGRLSRMDAIQVQAMAKATASRRALQVVRLHAALRRLADGDYGYCAECRDETAKKRLEFNPAAVKCISCASP